jgi:hypothetical protein
VFGLHTHADLSFCFFITFSERKNDSSNPNDKHNPDYPLQVIHDGAPPFPLLSAIHAAPEASPAIPKSASFGSE